MSEESAEFKTPFFSGKVSSANLNTIFTVASFAIVCMLTYMTWTHAADAKDSIKEVASELKASNKDTAQALRDANKDLAISIKEQTQAIREQTCLLSLPQEKRESLAETCKRISR